MNRPIHTPTGQETKLFLQRTAEGDEKAFERLFVLHKDRVFEIALLYTESRVLAEEILQDNSWVEKEDKDFAFRKKTNFAIINIHFYWYLMHVINNIGGIYQYEKYEGDPFPAWKAVTREVQKESIRFILETLENLEWMNNPELEQHIGGMNGNAGDYMRTVLFPYVMRWVANIGLSEAKGGNDPYTRAECVKDVFDYVWADVLAGKKVSAEKLKNAQTGDNKLQYEYLLLLINKALKTS